MQTKQKAMEELTPGQAAVMARNEQQIDKVTEEMEDLEEVLTDSIADSIRGKRQKAEAEADPAAQLKRRCSPLFALLMFSGAAKGSQKCLRNASRAHSWVQQCIL